MSEPFECRGCKTKFLNYRISVLARWHRLHRLRSGKPKKNGLKRAEMTTLRTHFTFRVDTWTPDGESIVEHVADVEDYQVALATFRAACERWSGTPITLRQGARVIEDSRRLRVV